MRTREIAQAHQKFPDDLAAETVARKVGLPPEQVFKTLVARGDKHGVCLAVVPGDCDLDLKALAACMGADRATISASALANNRVPVLLAVGSKDTVVASTRALATAIGNSRLVEIEGRDHLNTPGDKRYKEAVLEFFAAALA